MGFINIENASLFYKTEPMKGNIARLAEFDAFHCLLSGSPEIAGKLKKKYPDMPSGYLDWLKVCNGGLLFDTILLSSERHDSKLGLDFDTYEEMNSEKAYLNFNLPKGFFCFCNA